MTDAALPAGPAPALSQLYFYLTQGCNLRCRHCWLSPKYDPEGRQYPVLSVEQFELATREAVPLGLSAVKLTGGEPLLHPRIADIIALVEAGGWRLAVETNGVLCTPALAQAISRCKRPHVAVSLDGVDESTCDFMRGVPGAFRAAQAAVRELVAAGLAPQIIMTVVRENAAQVDAMVRLAEQLGAGSVKFNLVQPTGRGEHIRGSEAGLDVAGLVALGRRVDMELAPTTKLKLCFDYPMAFRPLSRLAADGGGGVCGILGILGVLPTGHYALCGIGEQLPDMVFGAVVEGGLARVWSGAPVLEELRAGLPQRMQGVCDRCLHKRQCQGSCVAQNYYRTGSLWSPYWLCEEAETAGVFPASRLTVPMDSSP